MALPLLYLGAIALGGYLLLQGGAKKTAAPPALGVPTGPNPNMPQDVLTRYTAALYSYDPIAVRVVADDLDRRGYLYEAGQLRQVAAAIDAMSEAEYAALVASSLRLLGAAPGSRVTVPYKGDPSAPQITVTV